MTQDVTTTEAPAPTVPAAVRAMRRAVHAGEPVPAETVRIWVETFMSQLYGPQKPARVECRPRHSRAIWMKATEKELSDAGNGRMEFRALYLHPTPGRVSKEHRWPPDSAGQGECLDCRETEWLAGPDCQALAPIRDPRTALSFNPVWLIEPLEKLHDLAKHLNPFDRDKWRREATYLIDRIKEFKETRS